MKDNCKCKTCNDWVFIQSEEKKQVGYCNSLKLNKTLKTNLNIPIGCALLSHVDCNLITDSEFGCVNYKDYK